VLRLTTIVNDLELLGDPIEEYKAVLKYLRVVPRKYRMVAMAIEQTVDLRTLTVEDLTGRFTTAEEGYNLDDTTDGVGKLLLTEEEWASHQRQRGGNTRNAAHGGGSGGRTSPKPKGGASGNNSAAPERHKGNCRYCGKAGHWEKECRKKKGTRSDWRRLILQRCRKRHRRFSSPRWTLTCAPCTP
jgi:hypothetical protein